MVEYVTPGTNLRWHLTPTGLTRVWVVGAMEPDFVGERDAMGCAIPTTSYRCVVPPTNDGANRLIRGEWIVTDDDVVAGLSHPRADRRAQFAALPDGALAAAQQTALTDDTLFARARRHAAGA